MLTDDKKKLITELVDELSLWPYGEDRVQIIHRLLNYGNAAVRFKWNGKKLECRVVNIRKTKD